MIVNKFKELLTNFLRSHVLIFFYDFYTENNLLKLWNGYLKTV